MNQATELTRTWLFAASIPLSHITWLSTMLLVATGLLAWVAAAALRFVADWIITPLVEKTSTRPDPYHDIFSMVRELQPTPLPIPRRLNL